MFRAQTWYWTKNWVLSKITVVFDHFAFLFYLKTNTLKSLACQLCQAFQGKIHRWWLIMTIQHFGCPSTIHHSWLHRNFIVPIPMFDYPSNADQIVTKSQSINSRWLLASGNLEQIPRFLVWIWVANFRLFTCQLSTTYANRPGSGSNWLAWNSV